MLLESMEKLIIAKKNRLTKKIMLYPILILICFSCARIHKDRYYESYCLLYGKPDLYLEILKDGQFNYIFRYAPMTVNGKWRVNKDTLILESHIFEKKGDSIVQMVKNTNINGKDAYIVKGKKLYALDSNNNVIKKCYLTLSPKNSVNLENY